VVLGAIAYRWVGLAGLGIPLIVFVLWEMLNPPRRYRIFGPDQSQEAVDNRFGIFGRFYRDDRPLASRGVRRNDPCPCGSGEKFKHCCGRDEER
jgi:uncharacterized protein YecA (UPF0149 family)